MVKFLITKDLAYLVRLPYIPEKQLALFSQYGLFKNGCFSDIRISKTKENRLYIDVTFLFLCFLLEQAYYFLPDLVDDFCLDFNGCFSIWHYTVFEAKDSACFMARLNQESFSYTQELWAYLTRTL